MIPDPFLEVIILLVLVWFFENKIIPQIGMMFLSLFMGSYWITNDASGNWQFVFFYVVAMVYSGMQIFYIEDVE